MTEQDRYLHANGQWTSSAAFELHATATARSAVCGHPGFVPDELLAALAGRDVGYPDADPAGLVAELCAAFVWKAVEGGYRVLDAGAVEVCDGRVRELRGEPKTSPARPSRRERPPVRTTAGGISRFGEPAGQGTAACFRCARCGELAGVIRLVRAGTPAGTGPLPGRRARDRGGLVLDCFRGTALHAAASEILDSVQALISQGDVDPVAIRELDWTFWELTPFYCPDCGLNYCSRDWDISREEYEGLREPAMGRCPAGHEHMAGGDRDQEPAPDPQRLIRLDRSWTFDGEDHVLTRAAYDLHLSGTAYSARSGHPGFVPDEYLNDRDPDMTTAVIELVTSGCWERAGGGYRVRDWLLVQWSMDTVAELRHRAAHVSWLRVRTEQEEVLRRAKGEKPGQ